MQQYRNVVLYLYRNTKVQNCRNTLLYSGGKVESEKWTFGETETISYICRKLIEVMEIPQGNSSEDVAIRRSIISNFYREWKEKNPLMKKYNLSLKEYINIGIMDKSGWWNPI